ncbi:LPS O-antigen chain length determinant protein WzzB [Salinivibrio costicola]|uniref:LPS chain length-determining protein n=1 Tax=Salinivibrio costicola TaxID=51367 RepID=A0ABX6K4Q4_SALCS|nr:Wzz/FepE/Etk N-terminal domain-containing protein [Salinivibrio costicola]QIR06517.1 LPS chain length-determining protein [Salinivibrio costicola]
MDDKNQAVAPQNITPPTFYQVHEDAIDIRELCSAIWAGKLTIITFTLLFSICAIFYALQAQEWWSSKAEISLPSVTDISEFQEQVNQYQTIFNAATGLDEKNVPVLNKQLSDLVDKENIFLRFTSLFSATQTKLDFFNQNEEFQRIKKMFGAQGATMSQDDVSGRQFYQSWLNRFKIEQDRLSMRDIISVQSVTAESSYILLTDYISFVSSRLNEQLYSDLSSIVKSETLAIERQKDSLKLIAKNTLKQEIERTENALKIAQSADINTPIPNQSNQELFPIHLGVNAISAKLSILKSLKDPSILEPKLSTLMAKIANLKMINIKQEKIQPFSVLEMPSKPLSRDKPKRVLIVIFGTFVGGMLGLVIILLRFTWNRHQK